MKAFVPIIAAVSLVAGSIGCGSGKDITGPPVPPNHPSPTQPSAAATFPALTRPGTIYGEQGELYALFSPAQGSLVSRYVIYDDGSFELQFISRTHGFFSYTGTYTKSATGLTLEFAESDSAGPWLGTVVFSGDQLSVKYNEVMMLADFIDGAYLRVPPK